MQEMGRLFVNEARVPVAASQKYLAMIPQVPVGTLTCQFGIMAVLEASGQNFAVSPDQLFVGRLC